MDQRTLLFYAQKGARERLADAAALQRQGLPADFLPAAVADAQEIARECLAEEVPVEASFARALTRVGVQL